MIILTPSPLHLASSLLNMQQTKQKASTLHDRAIIKCQYSVAPFAGADRKKRRVGDRRALEIALALQQSFESVLHLHLFPRSEINIFIQVLQSDGGELSAAFNAASLALVDAGIPMTDFLVSCSVGYLEKTPLIDLNQMEVNAGGPVMPLALLPASDKIMLLQLDSKLPFEVFETLTQVAMDACKAVYAILSNVVKEHTIMKLKQKEGY